MSIVLASSLTARELRRLGNNFGPCPPPRVRRPRPLLSAINRSLAVHGESVRQLVGATARRSA